MQFVYPAFLAALAAVSIPIIIHLFNFRRFKTVYFSNVKFLREVKEETASRSRLKHLLILACRILAISFLVLAFAQPFIPKKNTNISAGKKFVSVYVDNSFSMNAVASGQRLLDKAKSASKEIVKNYAADDKFQLLTNDFQGKHQRLVSKEEYLSMIDELEISPAARNLKEITKRQEEALAKENSTNKVAYLLSDFQTQMGKFQPDSTVKYNLVPLAGDAQNNVYIDSCWFNEPVQLVNQANKLVVRIRNSGNKSVDNSRLLLKLNGQTKAIAEYAINPNSYKDDTLNFTLSQSGWNKAELSITDYPITYDDNYFLAFKVLEKVKVLSIYQDKADVYVDGFYKNEAAFDYTSVAVGQLDYAKLAGNQLIVLDGLKTIPSGLSSSVETYLANGGSVAVFPAAACNQDEYNRFFTTLQANTINGFAEQPQDLAPVRLQQSLFSDVFEKVPENMSLPKAKKYYTFSKQTRSGEDALLSLKDGNAFLSKYTYKAGTLYVCASPLDKDYSELPIHALFVPMLYKMAVLNTHQSNLSYFLGDKTRIETEIKSTGGEKVYKIKGADVEFIPEQYALGNKMLLGIKDQIKKAGFYSLYFDHPDSADVIALNYNRKESDLNFYSPTALKEEYPEKNVQIVNAAGAEITQVIKDLDRGTALWKWCIVLTLLFLAIEIALLRLWRA